MKQILLEKGAVTLHDVPSPHVGDHEVLVVVYYSFIDSGSNRTVEHATVDDSFVEKLKRAFHIVGSTQGSRSNSARNQPRDALRVLGVSCSGQVIAVGSHVQHVAVGDWVACASAEHAVHAELVSVPEHLVAVLQSKRYIRSASISAIGARALHTLRRANVQFGEWVAVIGLGLLGQLTVQLARLQGCKVIAIDVIESRRDIAKKLGADRVYDAEDQHIVQHIVRMTHNAGVDAALITAHSSSSTVINQAAMITRKRGNIVVAGEIDMTCDRQLMADKEIDLLLATSYGPGRFNPEYEQYSLDYPYPYVRWTAQRNLQSFVDALERETLYIDDLITHEYELDEVDAAYQQVMRKTTVGIVLKYRYEEAMLSAQTKTVSLLPAARVDYNALRVGVLGISSEAEYRLLPTLAHVQSLRISTLVDTDHTHVYQTGRAYNADYVSTDPEQLLASKYIEAIAIDDPASMKDKYVFHQLEQGIGVFLTRMPLLNAHELNKWRVYAQRYASAPICMNLHRSFSSHIRKIASTFATRNTPLFVNYRIIIDDAKWDEHNASWEAQIIDYIAHAIDIFITLTQKHIRTFSVLPLHAPYYHMARWSNCVVHFTFEDGSVCSLTLTSLGSSQAGTEYLEVFSDGATITLSDFIELYGYGLEQPCQQAYFDDGYDTLVRLFFEPYGLPEFVSPMRFDHIVTVAEIAMGVRNYLYASAYHTDSYASAYTSIQR